MFEQVMGKLREDNIAFEVCPIILKCRKEENIRRLIKDGREMERIERGIKNTFFMVIIHIQTWIQYFYSLIKWQKK